MLYRTKVFLILISVVGFSCGVLLFLCLRTADSMRFRLVQEKVLAIAVTNATHIDGTLHETLTSPDHDENEAYIAIRNPLRASRDANREGELPVSFIYTMRPLQDGSWIFVVDAEEPGEDKSLIGDLVEFENDAEIPILGKAHVDSSFATDSFGTWLTAYAPIKDSAGVDVGLVGVDIAADEIIAHSQVLKRGGWLAFGVALLLAAIGSIFLSRRVTAPLEELGEQVRRIGEGTFDHHDRVGEDEFGNLGKALNQMAAALREREALKGALVRYVSTNAISNVSDMGNGIEPTEDGARKVTVLSAGLTGLDEVSNFVSSDEVYSLLKEWFSRTIDNILRHHGTIEKSEGEVVTALFGMPLIDTNQERNAFSTALNLQRVFQKTMNGFAPEHREIIGIRIAIHTGTVAVPGSNTETDYRSVEELLAAAYLIRKDQSVGSGNGTILITEGSAQGLLGAIPMEDPKRVQLEHGEVKVHTVEMPVS